ncbi:MAG: response regulator transcription factor [Actinomycetota bacterium]|nr:response regulator transcription factor [Actinomycetota bacterium]
MSEGAPTRVYVVAPTALERSGLRAMLADAGAETGILLVGEAATLDETDSWLSEADVVVVVAGDGLLEEAARAVAEEGTQAILLLSDDDRSVPVLRSLAPRGWGVVSPDAPPEEFLAAVAATVQGLVVLPRTLTGRLIGEPANVEEPSEPLTAREREVLELLGRGLSNKMIAKELHISEHTVKFHISSIYTKLGVASRTEAINRGARQGLISL